MTRDAGTDERFDDLRIRMDDGFRRVDERLGGIDERIGGVDERLGRVELDLRELRSEVTHRLDTTQRIAIQIGGGMLVTMLVGFLSVLVSLH